LIVGQAAAQEARITELQLEGCRVTEPQKVLAAIGFQPGMPYDAERLQKALMDLGLFESVTLETTQIPQGVRVTAKVQEKTHPAPKTEEAARALNPSPSLASCFRSNKSHRCFSLNKTGEFPSTSQDFNSLQRLKTRC